jgi:isocitrate/isopropylmalate dehydrogenase
MMCEFLGETDAAARIQKAVEQTDDVEGSTAQVGDAIAAAL